MKLKRSALFRALMVGVVRSMWSADGHLLCALLMLCGSSGHAATISASSSVVYEDEPGRGSLQVSNGPIGSLSTASFTSVSGLAAGSYGEAAFGVLHASASSIAVNELAQTRGLGSAFWVDQVTFSSTTLTGPAFARVSFSLSGGLSSMSEVNDVGSAANSTIGATVTVNGGKVFTTTGQLVSNNGVITINDLRRGQALN